ncbi:exopolyphosphatase/guanosine-5'-triphosphate,3'-diphosphate pyrophosphatase [Anoxybacillus voinovskiensis]|uniref:exopolyphosphatase n=1 Tax=Anoxybacteroides voinovskiense TaxID=230470 RepID=A0A840DZE4_9BACL|nr:exopolyphosphatase [Anoxybacillus voinovskiensis]MBB4074879.1 exopolyphosphatase/guanosine-5'-triphosphate,3'-diphosphate pyrophosphatase [Anoxybacillus voinovskiensis]GGJ74714.1 exopolyphosphatase [Anoxybacillus voinovskiensis]
MKEKYGIIDIGSNTIRLVIYERQKSGRLREMENVKAVARLRNYLTDEHILTEEGIFLLLDTLRSFQEITRHHQLERVICVATATIRQAKNKQEIIELVEKNTDFRMRVLTGEEEAYYGFLAVVNSTAITEAITVDIGGGSTEVTYYKDRELLESYSFPFGALSLRQAFVAGNVPTEEELKRLSVYLTEQFQSLPWLVEKKVPLVAMGGSARNIVQIHQLMKQYPLAGVHQYEMKRKHLLDVRKLLTSLSFEELQKLEGLSKDRADLIIPALEVFCALYDAVDASSFVLSRKGLRDGIFYEELIQPFGTRLFPNVLQESFYELAQDYDIRLDDVQHVNQLLAQLVAQIRQLELYPITEEDVRDMKQAAHVFYLGQYIDEEASSQHTFYLLANRTIDGLMHKDRVKLALIASYKNKPLFKQYIAPFSDWFSKDEQRRMRFIGALVKFAHSLNDTKRKIVQHIALTKQPEAIVMDITCTGDFRAEEYQAEKNKKQLEKLWKQPIELRFRQ